MAKYIDPHRVNNFDPPGQQKRSAWRRDRVYAYTQYVAIHERMSKKGRCRAIMEVNGNMCRSRKRWSLTRLSPFSADHPRSPDGSVCRDTALART